LKTQETPSIVVPPEASPNFPFLAVTALAPVKPPFYGKKVLIQAILQAWQRKQF